MAYQRLERAKLSHEDLAKLRRQAQTLAAALKTTRQTIRLAEKARTVCGTQAAYVRHIRAGEPACSKCKAANAEYQKARRRTAASRQLKPCGTEAAHRRHLRNNERPCNACIRAHREYQANKRRPKAGK